MGFLRRNSWVPDFLEKAEGEKGKRLPNFNEYDKFAAIRPRRPNRSTPSLSILEELVFGPAGHHGNHREEKKGK
jgi:hypothetical protein